MASVGVLPWGIIHMVVGISRAVTGDAWTGPVVVLLVVIVAAVISITTAIATTVIIITTAIATTVIIITTALATTVIRGLPTAVLAFGGNSKSAPQDYELVRSQPRSPKCQEPSVQPQFAPLRSGLELVKPVGSRFTNVYISTSISIFAPRTDPFSIPGFFVHRLVIFFSRVSKRYS